MLAHLFTLSSIHLLNNYDGKVEGPVLIFSFAAAVLGGLDSSIGAVVGGLSIGVLKNLSAVYVPPEVGSVDVAMAFLVIVLVLMVRPAGLFGRPAARRV